ncbi:MAG: hypothetical protein PHG87_00790 [Candidatus Omnitrophica bacterium]|nr:hypothetical protein [Candidatus Omnitrophota bacterium]
MCSLNFGSDGYVTLPTKFHGDVKLSSWKWEIICAKPERQWYRFNSEKIPTTLVAPDYVRLHHNKEGQVFYYKEFARYKLTEQIEIPASERFKFFAVIIDLNNGNTICTIYPVGKPKKGKEFKPEEVEA